MPRPGGKVPAGGAHRAISAENDGRKLNRHYTDFFLDFGGLDHDDRIPWAAVKEATIGALADAFLAADAENGVHLNAAEGRMIFIRHPEHAVFNRAIFHAGGRAGAARAALGDDRQLLWLLLARGRNACGFGFELELVRHHADGPGLSGHAVDY